MFCGKCGTPNPDNATFCGKCGAKLNAQKMPPVNSNANGPSNVQHYPPRRQPAQKSNHRQDVIVGMIAVAVVALAAVFLLFGGRSYKSTIDKYIKAQYEVDAKTIIKLIPNDMVDYMLEDDGYDRSDLDDLIDDANDNIQRQVDYIKNYIGEDWKMSYEITDVEDVKGDDLKDLKKEYKRMGVRISAAKVAEIELTITVDDSDVSNSMEIALIKVGRSWYIDPFSMGGVF